MARPRRPHRPPRAAHERPARSTPSTSPGPGTDLTVGLLPESRWQGVESETAQGLPYVANMPTEEIFTTPDCAAHRGLRPLDAAARALRAHRARARGALRGRPDRRRQRRRGRGRRRAGSSRPTSSAASSARSRSSTARRASARPALTFFETLYDENATCHVAYGSAYAEAVEGEPATASTSRPSTPTSWSAARTSTSTPCCRTAPSCRSCGKTSGSSTAT